MDELGVVQLAVRKGALSERDAERAAEEAGRSGRGVLETLVASGVLNDDLCRELSVELAEGLTAVAHPDDGTAQHPSRRDTLASSIEQLASAPGPVTGFPVGDWDRYEFIRLLGEGGMGQVFLAFDPRLGRRVALKFLRGGEAAHLERFVQEARAQAHVEHDNICRIYEVGRVADRPYIAMQYVEGEPLDRASAGLALEKKLLMVAQVADAVHEAHRSGLIHRDIKPANIMVENGGGGVPKPYLLDFGLAREQASRGLTMSGAVLGTPQYMAPEQAAGETRAVDRRADVYALGATLYAIVSGRPPFQGKTLAVLLRQVLEDVPAPLSTRGHAIPADVEAIIMKCLRKDPSERYKSARALARDIRRYLDGEPVEARPTTVFYRLRMMAARNRLAVTVATVATLLVLAATAWGSYNAWSAARRARVAQSFGQEVERIDSFARAAYTIPLHDVRPDREEIRVRMAGITARMEELGAVARGAGEYALGRGHLVLGQYDEARESLEAARSDGFDDPQLDYALGRALGELFFKAHNEAQAIADKAARTVRLEQIDRELRSPALAALRRGRGGQLESPDYVEALIALHEDRYDDALQLAAAAFSGRLYMYEARGLAGQIHAQSAVDLGLAGDYEAALEQYALAETALRDALEVGRSDPRMHLEFCRLFPSRMRTEVVGPAGDPTSIFERGMAACETALVVDEEEADVRLQIAGMKNRMAEYRISIGEDARSMLAESIAAARAALSLDPRKAAAFDVLASAYSSVARIESNEGGDPEDEIGQVIQAFEKGIEIHPQHWRYNDLGVAYKMLAQRQAARGEDVTESLDRSIASYQRSLELYPEQTAAWGNLGQVYFNRAGFEIDSGDDPNASLDAAIAAFDRALALDPEQMVVHYNVARTYARFAEIQASRGEDSNEMLARAATSYRRAIDINPESAYVAHFRNGLGGVIYGQALHGWGRGENPEPRIAEALAILVKARQANPRLVYPPFNIAQSELLRARHAIATGGDPGPAGERAIEAAEEAIRLNPDFLSSYEVIGRASALLARHATARGASAETLLARGRAVVDAGLQRGPDRPVLLAIAALLELERGRAALREGRKPDAAFGRAGEFLDRIRELAPGMPVEVQARARLRYESMRLGASRGSEARQAARASIEALSALLDKNGSDADTRALRGALLLECAEMEPVPETRRANAREAAGEIGDALRQNAQLDREYRPLLERAKKLAA